MSERPIVIAQRSFLVALALIVAGCPRRNLEPTPMEPPRPPQVLRPRPDFRAIEGTESIARESTLFVLPLPDIGVRLEVRTISIAQTEGVTLPTTSEVALEVRSGDVETVIDGERQLRATGEMFVVPAGARLTIGVRGQHAVLRGVYLVRVP
jgi:hypothetical protein